MLQHTLKKIFGDRNQRLLKNIGKTVDRINALESEMSALDDQALAARSGEFRARIKDGAKRDDLLVEAFAVVREASVRTLGLRHFDVQLVGGVVLNSGKIAEMKTGEGKTLAATLPAYLNAIANIPVHIVTVNDYLARRDAEWMGKIYDFLGLSVGVIASGQEPQEKRRHTKATSCMAPITNSALIICATTWRSPPMTASRTVWVSPSSTRWIRFS